jgi:hypothetical protein
MQANEKPLTFFDVVQKGLFLGNSCTGKIPPVSLAIWAREV